MCPILLLLFFFLLSSEASLSTVEIDTLEEFFNATSYRSPTCLFSSSWCFTPPYVHDPCEENWVGVTCNSDNSFVFSLVVRNCFLSGTIPANMDKLAQLNEFNVSQNKMTGTIPSSMLSMVQLRKLDVSYNSFAGTLPNQLRYIRDLNLFENLFSGSLPSSWVQMTGLNVLNISGNELTGTIPNGIGVMKRMRIVDMSNNDFNGTIPPNIFKLNELWYLSLSDNQLTGTIPSELFSARRLSDIDLSNNGITGPLPSASSGTSPLPPLLNIYFSSNYLSSTIPKIFGSLEDLVMLDLSSNNLMGTIPPRLFNNSGYRLKFLYLQSNYLEGSIPKNIGKQKQMMHVFLFDNRLTGSLPSSMGEMSSLQSLLLQDNKLTGRPGAVLKSESFILNELLAVDLSNNLFTGQVPGEIFELPKIQYVSIAEGCFEGSIPKSVCSTSTLTHLILEGLSSGDDCSLKLWDPFGLFSQRNLYSGGIIGGVPECLFQLKNLTTLHLSGNGLDGSIPVSTEPYALKDLSLSYNKLTGSIPANLLGSSYSQFDLSHNRISGTCDKMKQWFFEDTRNVDTHLLLSSNRLSGDIPNNFNGMDDVNILEGNVFKCGSRSDLPVDDPNYLTYICASDDYDKMLQIYGSLIGAFSMFLVIFLMIHYYKNDTSQQNIFGTILIVAKSWAANIQQWDNSANSVSKLKSPQTFFFLKFLKLLREFVVKLTALIVVMFSLIYFILKWAGESGTHTYQYSWITSAAYLSGTLAASLIVGGVAMVICFTLHGMRKLDVTSRIANDPTDRNTSCNSVNSLYVQKDPNGSWKEAYLIIFFGLLVNAIVTLFINGVYVYTLMWYELSADVVVALQISKSCVDILWNNVAIRMFVKKVKGSLRIKRVVRLVLAMLLFNNIAAPILSSLVTDENCFVGLFVDYNDISTSTDIGYCAKLKVVNTTSGELTTPSCDIYKTLNLETSYTPKFLYNYQCSSSFLANYIPIFIFSSGSVTFIVPVLQMAISYLLTHRISPDKIPVVPPGSFFPGILLPRNPNHHIFSTDMVMARFLLNITVMMTFGIACPNLAFVLGTHVFIMTWYYHLFLGRYLTVKDAATTPNTKSTQHEHEVINPVVAANVEPSNKASLHISESEQIVNRNGGSEDNDHDSVNSTSTDKITKISKRQCLLDPILENDCLDVTRAPRVAVWTIIDTCAICIALMLIDVSGDQNGFNTALLTASLPVMCLPFVLRIMYQRCYMLAVNALQNSQAQRQASIAETESRFTDM